MIVVETLRPQRSERPRAGGAITHVIKSVAQRARGRGGRDLLACDPIPVIVAPRVVANAAIVRLRQDQSVPCGAQRVAEARLQRPRLGTHQVCQPVQRIVAVKVGHPVRIRQRLQVPHSVVCIECVLRARQPVVRHLFEPVQLVVLIAQAHPAPRR